MSIKDDCLFAFVYSFIHSFTLHFLVALFVLIVSFVPSLSLVLFITTEVIYFVAIGFSLFPLLLLDLLLSGLFNIKNISNSYSMIKLIG